MDEQLSKFISEGTPQDIIERYRELPHLAEENDFGEFDNNIVVLDTETTGFSLNHDELTQIAAARVEGGKIVDWYVTFVNPGKSIPDEVAHLTDIHDEDVAGAPTPQEALVGLVEFVKDAKIVAHNAEFDRNFTTKHPEGYPLLSNIWLDSLELSRIALPRMKSHRLIDLVRAFGAPESTHRADDDVAATCALLRILLAGVAAMPPSLVRKISRIADEGVWPTSVVFEYFAKRSAQAAEQTMEEGQETHIPAFSLVTMRRNRVKNLNAVPKKDVFQDMEGTMRPLSFPDLDKIGHAFTRGGLVGSLYSGYEMREEQQTMAKAVQRAITTGRNLMVEAGTGVGKSMAYLVPLALSAIENDMTVGVATKTNALLDQLVYQELPALADALARQHGTEKSPLTFTALKGFSHYPCLQKIRRMCDDGVPASFTSNPEYAPALAALLSFVEQSEYSDIDTLKINYKALPKRLFTTTSAECLRRKCPFYGTSCFVHGARRLAEAANIVVTNHSLLFCDIAAEGGLLPDIRYWVVDEAHGAETEARRALSVTIESAALQRMCRRVVSRETSVSLFARAERVVVVPQGEEGQTLFYALTNKASGAGSVFAEAAQEYMKAVRGLLYYDSSKSSKGYETVEIWINDEIRSSSTFADVVSKGSVMSEAAEKLITACQELVGYLDDLEGAAVIQREIAALAIELKELVAGVETILLSADDRYVYSVTLSRKGDRPVDTLEAMLYNVGAYLDEAFYSRTNSVVYASATLTIAGSFAPAMAALGLNQSEQSACDELELRSSYDFDRNMIVYVANDLPEPNDPRYMEALEDLLIRAHRAQGGSMLTLFTNRKEMEKSFEAVQTALKEDDLRVVCQKWGVSVKGLRDDFLADEHLSLFALKSFWEGFDAPGATLRGVIIPKLPFAKPTDPLSCERSARDDYAWRNFVLPAAVMETKQAAGRLIRRSDDTGVLILADSRLVSKSYGKTFLKSMPSRTIRICSVDQIIAELEGQVF